MNTSIKIIVFIVSFFINDSIYSNEMIIGKETIEPGIDIIFEAAIKDEIKPKKYFLDQDYSFLQNLQHHSLLEIF